MLRGLLAATLVMGSVIVTSATNVKAQSVNMPFSGTVETNCTFGTPTTGRLSPSSTNPNTLSAEQSNDGNPANASTVTLNCSAPASLSVSAPIQTGGPSLTPTNCNSTVLVGRTLAPLINYSSCGGFSSPVTFPNTFADPTLLVFMSVQNASAVPSGAYSYEVTLTVAP